jgi:DNA-directed RNA polymerase specialized sigma24 family protein
MSCRYYRIKKLKKNRKNQKENNETSNHENLSNQSGGFKYSPKLSGQVYFFESECSSCDSLLIEKQNIATPRLTNTQVDAILEKKYKGATRKRINKKLPDFQYDDRMDVLHNTFTAFLGLARNGNFRGEYGELSIGACLSSIADNECADFINAIEEERERRVYSLGENRNVYDKNGDNFQGDWKENYPESANFLYDHEVLSEEAKYERKLKIEFIMKESKYPGIMKLRRDGFTIDEIANMLGLTKTQVKNRLARDIRRIYKKAKSFGWTEYENGQIKDADKLLKMLTSKPSKHYDQAKKKLSENDLKDLGYTLPTDESSIDLS